MKYWLVMPAAGTGRRFGERIPKQYAVLRGRTLIEWALAPFLTDSRCAGAVVALAPEDLWWPKISERIATVSIAPGGAERSESVRNALAGLNRRAQKTDWVLVHDAARPCLPTADLDRLLERAGTHAVGGILAQPVADTLKCQQPDSSDASTDRTPSIDQTISREGLWRAATPQMFRYGALTEALDRAIAGKRYPTDEAQALEWVGEHPLLVEGSALNIKVTTADDLVLAEAILAAREGRKK
jgi:2-C-methyl-D-erythritol 4-phosphate cytidylyltransferase